MSKMCDTCIFRPGNLMMLKPGRVESMVAQATRNEGHIPCHMTTYQQSKQGEAVCHGFFKIHRTSLLQIAERLGVIEWQSMEEREAP